MSDIYARRFFCIIRWMLFLTSIISIIAGNTILGGFAFAFAAMLAGNKYKYHIPLAKRYKWIGICWVIYFLIFLIHVIIIKGKVFNDDRNLFFFMFPWVPEIIYFEMEDFRGRIG